MRLIDADSVQEGLAVLILYSAGTTEGECVDYAHNLIEAQPTVEAIPISFILEEERKMRKENMARDIPLTTPIIEANTLEALIEAWRNQNKEENLNHDND